MMILETSQLQTLVAVSKAGSFSKAAEDLSVTQSAISQSVKNLENKVGVQVFNRTGKRVTLTQEGEKLFRLGKEFLTRIDDTIEDIQERKDKMRGKIRIGTLTGIGKSWLSPLLIDFISRYPEISLDVQMEYEKNLLDEFDNFQLDCLIVPESILPSNTEKILITEEKATLVYPDLPEYQLGDAPDLTKIGKFPVICFEHEDSLFLKWCRHHFGRVPLSIRRKLCINSHGSMLQAVSKGLGLAVLPTHVLNRSYYRDKVMTLGKEYELISNRIYLVYRKEAANLKRIQALVDLLQKESDKSDARTLD